MSSVYSPSVGIPNPRIKSGNWTVLIPHGVVLINRTTWKGLQLLHGFFCFISTEFPSSSLSSLLSSSLPLLLPLPSLSPAFVLCCCVCFFPPPLSHLFISNNLWFRVLAAWREPHPLRHFFMKSSRSTTKQWTNSLRWSQNMDPLARKRSFDQFQVVLRRRLARTDPVNARVQAVPLGDGVLSMCKCLHVHAFFWSLFDRLETRTKESNFRGCCKRLESACSAQATEL